MRLRLSRDTENRARHASLRPPLTPQDRAPRPALVDDAFRASLGYDFARIPIHAAFGAGALSLRDCAAISSNVSARILARFGSTPGLLRRSWRDSSTRARSRWPTGSGSTPVSFLPALRTDAVCWRTKSPTCFNSVVARAGPPRPRRRSTRTPIAPLTWPSSMVVRRQCSWVRRRLSRCNAAGVPGARPVGARVLEA
jgi:hypothetical protein